QEQVARSDRPPAQRRCLQPIHPSDQPPQPEPPRPIAPPPGSVPASHRWTPRPSIPSVPPTSEQPTQLQTLRHRRTFGSPSLQMTGKDMAPTNATGDILRI